MTWLWNSPNASDARAATWVNDDTGYPLGETSAGVSVMITNAIYGTKNSDIVGCVYSSAALGNGDCIIVSTDWNSPTLSKVGAATSGNGY